VVLRLY